MCDQKTDHEVLRLHTQCPLGGHGQYQIDGLAFRLVQDNFGIAEEEPVKTDNLLPRCFVELHVSPQCVADPARFRIEADIPREIDIARLDQRLDVHFGREQMRDPFLDHLAQRVEPAPAGGPSMATSGETGSGLAPETFSSSAARSDPSCTLRRCGRKKSSAARSMNTSSQPSRTLRRITCASWLMNSGGVAPTPRRTRSRYAASSVLWRTSRSRKAV